MPNLMKNILLTFFLAATLQACGSTMATHGQIIPEQNLAILEKGEHDKRAVLRFLGSPSSVTPFNEQEWIYITTSAEQKPFAHDVVTDRQILIVQFDDNDKLKNIERHDNSNSRSLTPLGKTTKTQGQSLGILDQMLENLGKGFGRSGE